MADLVKIISLTSGHENPLVVIQRDWDGELVVCTEVPATPMAVHTPAELTIPLFDMMGPISKAEEAEILRKATSRPVDIYLVAIKTKAGVHRNGMVAVPRAHNPTLEVR